MPLNWLKYEYHIQQKRFCTTDNHDDTLRYVYLIGLRNCNIIIDTDHVYVYTIQRVIDTGTSAHLLVNNY